MISRRNCRAVLCYCVLADREVFKECLAVFIGEKLTLDVAVRVGDTLDNESYILNVEVACCCLCDLYRTLFEIVRHFGINRYALFGYLIRIHCIVNDVLFRCCYLVVEILAVA